jgi:hypothetical protein
MRAILDDDHHECKQEKAGTAAPAKVPAAPIIS